MINDVKVHCLIWKTKPLSAATAVVAVDDVLESCTVISNRQMNADDPELMLFVSKVALRYARIYSSVYIFH